MIHTTPSASIVASKSRFRLPGKTRKAVLAAAVSAVALWAIPQRSSAAVNTWVGGIDTNWQTNGNWTTANPGGIPVAGDSLVWSGTTNLTSNNDFTAGTSFAALTFSAGAGAFNLTGNGIALTGALTNSATGVTQTIGLGVAGTGASSLAMIGGTTGTVSTAIGASSTFGSFSLSDTPLGVAGTIPASILTVASGQVLTINGAFQAALNAASAVNVVDSLTSGAVGTGGELDVNGAFTVGVSNGAGAGKNTTTVDLSGLTTVRINSAASTLNIGNGTNIRGNLTLASGTSSVNAVTVATINLGTSGGGNAQTGSQLNMGQGTNTIYANTINIGGGKSNGVFQFVGSSASATATIAGTSSTVGNLTNANITLGSQTSGTATSQTSSLLLAGHNVTVQAGTVIVGQSNGNSGGTGIATVTFDTGTFNIASGLQLAVGAGTTSGTAGSTGTFTLGGTGTLNVSGLFNLANNTNSAASPGTSTATFTINGGTANINTNIVVASTKGTSVTTLTLAGGTLNMNGFAVGGGGAANSGNAAITNVNLPGASQTATLANLGGTGINGAGLTMNGAGTLIVGGASTNFSGATTINSGGTLQVGSATLAEQLPAASVVTNNGTLNFAGSNTATIANAIGGGGVVNQTGTGTTILSNTSNYSGNTGVSAGALVVNGGLLSSGNVNLSGTGTLAGGGSVGNVTVSGGTLAGGALPVSTSGTLTMASLNMSAGNLQFNIGTATSNSIAVTGAANFTGGGFSLQLGGAPTNGQTFTVLTSGGLTDSGLNLAATTIGRTSLTPSVSGNNLIVTVSGGPATLVWNNVPGAGDGLTWDVQNTLNWNSAAPSDPFQFFQSDNVVFNDSNNGNYVVALNTSVAPASMLVDSAGSYSISGTGSITGSTGITKTGSGLLLLATANTYTGATAVQNGTLRLGIAGAIASSAAVTLGDGATASGVLDLNGFAATVASLAVSGTGSGNAITNSGGVDATLTFAGGSSTFAGSMIDGATNKLGLTVSSGTLALSGSNAYTGTTTINAAATLAVGTGGTSGSLGSTAVVDNGTLAFNRSDAVIDTHAISGSGAVSQLATSTLTLAGALTYTGATNIATGGSVRIGGTTQSLSGAVNGGGNLIVGDGTNPTSLTLNNAGNGYTGSTTVNAGSTLVIPTAGSIAANSGVTLDGGTEVINSATSGKNFGTGKTITIAAGGGTIRYGSVVTAGLQNVLQVNGPLTIDINDSNGATKNTYLDNANISGSGNILFTNTGTWEQDTYQLGSGTTNNSGYNGNITVGGPTGAGLRLQPVNGTTSALGSGTVTVTNGSQLFMGGNATYANTFNLAGIGTLVDSPRYGAMRMANGQTLTGTINLTADANISAGTNAANTAILTGQISGPGNLSLQTGVFTLNNGTANASNYGSTTPGSYATVLTRHDTAANSGPATLVVGNVNSLSTGGMLIDGGALELNGNSVTVANLASIGPNGVIISPTANNGNTGNSWFLASSTNSISSGNRISGVGIPVGTFVNGVATQETPAVSPAAVLGATTITVNSVVGLVAGQTVSGTGVATGTKIQSISGNVVTLDTPLSGAIANNATVTVATGPVITISQPLSAPVGSSVAILHNGAVSNDGPSTTANATLTFGGDNTNQTFGGLLLDGNSGGTLGITKVGTGNETFTNVNTYTGNTNVNDGTLTIDATGGLAGTNVTVASAGTLTVLAGGTLSAATVLTDNGTVNLKSAALTIASVSGGSSAALNLDGALTLSNGGTFNGVIANGTGTGSVTVGGGTLTLGGLNTYGGNTTVNAAGTLAVTSGGALPSGTNLTADGAVQFANASQTIGTLNGASTGSVTAAVGSTLTVSGLGTYGGSVNANGTVKFSGNTGVGAFARSVGAVTVGSGGTVELSASVFPATPSVLTTTGMSFADPTAKLDLKNNEVLVTGTTLAAVVPQIIAGNVTTTSTGGGVGSLQVGGDVEVRFTLLGDTNLDGKVDVTDLGNLASSYGTPSGATWVQGDTNYSGAVDVTDLGNLASNYGGQLATGPAAGEGGELIASSLASVAPGGGATVPEPASLALIGLGAASLMTRRRRC